jgi:uncharacterized phage protein (TIGR01671 family)
MRRKIKFRAWDSVAKRWMYPYPNGFHILGETNCFQMIEQQLYERKQPDESVLLMLNDVIIVQYTGLKDKHGVEIYEGDIVTYQECMYQVKYMDTKACFSLEGVGQFKRFMDIMATVHDSGFTTDKFEVVGNIFENEDVLNEETK